MMIITVDTLPYGDSMSAQVIPYLLFAGDLKNKEYFLGWVIRCNDREHFLILSILCIDKESF